MEGRHRKKRREGGREGGRDKKTYLKIAQSSCSFSSFYPLYFQKVHVVNGGPSFQHHNRTGITSFGSLREGREGEREGGREGGRKGERDVPLLSADTRHPLWLFLPAP